ncbi:DUF6123 family protein [Jeotgalibacillus proteolyticus]|uniref:Uncharacterized protein n=1 Tax=Jeotgalibacillus proteolyticus TaxID=2082395 RepID=A0A2S5GDZ1_9BACL|nr:DUF6123 family protein [Jeotgalibacillus proteolyticus]PPA71216.1 hypothetical protein C4B60_03880 [Jeotgalibacillus proteolyticus]
MKSLEDFLADLETKGFKLNDEAIGFIYFGRKYTDAPDQLVQVAIEVTLKLQQRFDSGFYMSVLEEIVQSKLTTRTKVMSHFRKKGIPI